MTVKRKELAPLSAAAAAQLEHDMQIAGARDPHGTRTADGITVAEAQERARAVNDEWHERRRAAAVPTEQASTETPAAD